MERSGSNSGYFKHEQCPEPEPPSLEPQILFKYPPGKKLPMRAKDVCAFSFPGGVKARMVERTPSLSGLNELVYGKGHLGRDDLAFVFSLKVADNATLYGVCLHVPEIVQRPPGILGCSSPFSHPNSARSRFLVSAPRCYCLLTRVPFFELHYEMLSSIIAQERLNRITHFLNKVNVTDSYISTPRTSERSYGFLDSPQKDCPGDWTSFVIPIDSVVALTAAAAGIIPDDEAQSFSVRTEEILSPPSISASEASDFGASADPDKDGEKGFQHFDDHASEISEESFQTVMHSPETSVQRLDQSDSSASLYSPTRSLDPQDDFDEFSFNQESDTSGDFMTMKWAKEQKNEFLQIVCAYGALPVPARGNDIVFYALEHLQPIQYRRPSVSDLGFDEKLLEIAYRDPLRSAEVNAKLAAAEEARALSVWTTATMCRVISLDNILALVAGVLLEKQVVVTCPNLGVLSATVLSLVTMIRPFEWQSLLLPVLPAAMMDFLDAPVPYLVKMRLTEKRSRDRR